MTASTSTSAKPAEANRVIRRYVHDLRNCANYIDLEAVMLLEDLTGPAADALQRMRGQLVQLEAVIRSLAVRFGEPSVATVAAADVFGKWKHMMESLPHAPPMTWEIKGAQGVVTMDCNAVLAILREIVVRAGRMHSEEAIALKMNLDSGSVDFQVHELSSQAETAKIEEWPEWQRIIAANGGTLSRQADGAGVVTGASFPSAA